jgi:hypothetical protein
VSRLRGRQARDLDRKELTSYYIRKYFLIKNILGAVERCWDREKETTGYKIVKDKLLLKRKHLRRNQSQSDPFQVNQAESAPVWNF